MLHCVKNATAMQYGVDEDWKSRASGRDGASWVKRRRQLPSIESPWSLSLISTPSGFFSC